MQQLPHSPWYRRWSVILAGVIGVAAITALLGWRGLQQVASPSPTTSVPTTAAESPSSATRPAPSTSRETPEVLWRAEGSDSQRSRLFRAPDRWRIIWSFDCSAFPGGQGNFKLTGEGAFDQVMIQAFDDEAEGSQPVRGGGSGRLVITSVCDRWEVQAVRA
ncbi:MAG TPA: hypothetical protein VFC13_01570 [Actinomycetes bacterium]|nr:hypothetical protein [Actinomycetes bacterium]